jgi:D-alanine-D-alanine ligase
MVTVLTGGESEEREVSLSTAKTICASLKNLGLPYVLIDIKDTDWLDQLNASNPDVAFIAVHGTFGEDGTLQAILEDNCIRHTGASAKVASITFDKRKTKEALGQTRVTVAREFALPIDAFVPVVVKPNAQGSSVGVSIVTQVHDLDPAISLASTFGPDILIEEFIAGRELSCAVIDVYGMIQSLPLVEIKPKNAFFDYVSKYTEGMSEEICPANLSHDLTRTIQALSEEIYRALGITQYCRIDWILSGDIPYFLEVNTIPGMTPTSLINKEIAAAGLSFDDFIGRLVKTAC